ncbi:MAG: hypothetical protein ABIC04_06125 [Nanoarchaeota archaeon]
MRIPKKYGMSRIDNCPFCGKMGITKNRQGISVCANHKDTELNDIKCACGEWLDIRQGKWGPYFHCMNCGNINLKKGLEMVPSIKKKSGKEITITSDQVDYFT